MSDTMKEFLKDVVGVVEATSYEALCLWREQHKEKSKSWESDNGGYLPTVGELDGRPVVISLFVNTVDGHPILFMEPTSQVVDHQMIQKWLMDHLPSTAFIQRDDGQHLNMVNAMNFHNVFPKRVKQ
jgi:hypothetical protein